MLKATRMISAKDYIAEIEADREAGLFHVVCETTFRGEDILHTLWAFHLPVTVDVFRKATEADALAWVKCNAVGIVEDIAQALSEDEDLSCEDGGPELTVPQDAGDAFTAALLALIAGNVDMSNAAIQSTGRTYTVTGCEWAVGGPRAVEIEEVKP